MLTVVPSYIFCARSKMSVDARHRQSTSSLLHHHKHTFRRHCFIAVLWEETNNTRRIRAHLLDSKVGLTRKSSERSLVSCCTARKNFHKIHKKRGSLLATRVRKVPKGMTQHISHRFDEFMGHTILVVGCHCCSRSTHAVLVVAVDFAKRGTDARRRRCLTDFSTKGQK